MSESNEANSEVSKAVNCVENLIEFFGSEPSEAAQKLPDHLEQIKAVLLDQAEQIAWLEWCLDRQKEEVESLEELNAELFQYIRMIPEKKMTDRKRLPITWQGLVRREFGLKVSDPAFRKLHQLRKATAILERLAKNGHFEYSGSTINADGREVKQFIGIGDLEGLENLSSETVRQHLASDKEGLFKQMVKRESGLKAKVVHNFDNFERKISEGQKKDEKR